LRQHDGHGIAAGGPPDAGEVQEGVDGVACDAGQADRAAQGPEAGRRWRAPADLWGSRPMRRRSGADWRTASAAATRADRSRTARHVLAYGALQTIGGGRRRWLPAGVGELRYVLEDSRARRPVRGRHRRRCSRRRTGRRACLRRRGRSGRAVLADVMAAGVDAPARSPSPRRPLLLLYTSGTTGRPRRSSHHRNHHAGALMRASVRVRVGRAHARRRRSTTHGYSPLTSVAAVNGCFVSAGPSRRKRSR
jgi:hypothetical protein